MSFGVSGNPTSPLKTVTLKREEAIKIKDLTGKKFGGQVVVGFNDIDFRGNSTWEVQCSCGDVRVVRGSKLTSGVKSCRSCSKKTHGFEKTHYIYRLWENMKKRCYNKKIRDFKYYGGRGIAVCKEWLDFLNFKDYILANLGERPVGFSLDRINGSKNYEPGNVRWASKKTQSLNRNRKYKRRTL